MADEADTKEKNTVPPLVRNAKGVAAHAAAVLEQQWDKERKVLRNPFVAALALFTYAKLTAALLDEAEDRFKQAHAALEVRTAKLEEQIAAFEVWRTEAQKQADEMFKGLDEMMGGASPIERLEEMFRGSAPPTPAVGSAAALPPAEPLTKAEAASTVVPLKPEKADKKREEKREEKKGGAA